MSTWSRAGSSLPPGTCRQGSSHLPGQLYLTTRFGCGFQEPRFVFKLLPRDERAPGALGDQQSLRTTEVRDARPSPPSTGRETEAQQT